jgi:hypothetical protein
MTDKLVFPPIRIRVESGELAGQWLEKLGVSEGEMRVLPINMGSVLNQPRRFAFHPSFTGDERAAHELLGLEVVDGYVRMLRSMGIDTQIVVGKGPHPITLN